MVNELKKEKLRLNLDTVFVVIAILAAGFHLYIGIFRVLNPQFERAIHLMFGIFFAYLLFIRSQKTRKWGKGSDGHFSSVRCGRLPLCHIRL